ELVAGQIRPTAADEEFFLAFEPRRRLVAGRGADGPVVDLARPGEIFRHRIAIRPIQECGPLRTVDLVHHLLPDWPCALDTVELRQLLRRGSVGGRVAD